MRITKDDALAKYMNIKTAIYFDTRCIISPTENGLVCVFREPNGIASKRQREWMHFIFDRIAKRLIDNFEITESQSGHFYLLATKNESNTDKKSRKTGEDKHTSEQKPEELISG